MSGSEFESEFGIQFTILRDGEEIGFGASLGSTLDHALYGIATIIQRREWETTAGMPVPESVDSPQDATDAEVRGE